MIVRIRCKLGTFRFKVTEKTKIKSKVDLDEDQQTLFLDTIILEDDNSSLGSLNISHGALIYLKGPFPSSNTSPSISPATSTTSASSSVQIPRISTPVGSTPAPKTIPIPSKKLSDWGGNVHSIDDSQPAKKPTSQTNTFAHGGDWGGNVHNLTDSIADTSGEPSGKVPFVNDWGSNVHSLETKSQAEKRANLEKGIEDVYCANLERKRPPKPKTSGWGHNSTSIELFAWEKACAVPVLEQKFKHVDSLQIDGPSGNMFQSYLLLLEFKEQRCGHLYGTFNENTKTVTVETIFEPLQIPTNISSIPLDGTFEISPSDMKNHAITPEMIEKAKTATSTADTLAGLLGWTRVGFIFSRRRTGKLLPLTNMEIYNLAQLQAKYGRHFTTITAVVNKKKKVAKFECFQLADSAIKLHNFKLFKRPKTLDDFIYTPPSETRSYLSRGSGGSSVSGRSARSGLRRKQEREFLSKIETIEEVNMAEKMTTKIDCAFFIIPTAIKAYSSIFTTSFPIEHRDRIPQTNADVKEAVKRAEIHLKNQGLPANEIDSIKFNTALSDFHLLYYLCKQLSINDVANIAASILNHEPISDGYIFMLNNF